MNEATLIKCKKMLKYLFKLTKKAGKIMILAKNALNIDQKLNSRDLVTEYDKKVQEYIESNLSKTYPEVHYLAEEGDDFGKVDVKKGELFIIDPIDGTSNFINFLNLSTISIAYVVDGETILGVVYNPFTDEYFYAIKGEGAYYNGEKIVMQDKSISQGLVGFGTAVYYNELFEKTKNAFCTILDKAMDLRRLGSASIDLCYLATGKFVGFFEFRLAPWDYAAGMLIIKEAGGIITDFNGEELKFDEKCSVLCGCKTAYEELKEILSKC